jgi:uncharacterized protein YsxB (DUF464 family)
MIASFMRYQSILFWILFIALGIAIVLGAVSGLYFLEVIFVLIIILLGSEKLREEVQREFVKRDLQKLSERAERAEHLMGAYTETMDTIHSKYNNRLFKLGNKHAMLDHQLEAKYRELVRKILDIENKLADYNRLLKDMAKAQQKRK